ncbi:MAG: DUF1254 domain-containing protein, partial [Abitibacteriaceae bacterium]|nr:DUF1254 domain-containing protein [Abditibacteriaceae bacterium]
NTLHHAHQPTPQDREVPMPSPDLIYSAGAYDVTQHPLHITAPLTGSYLSLSLYADNMDNFFVQNDRQVQHHQFDVIVVGPGDPLPHATGSLVVRAPSATGIILFRCFAGTRLALRKVADVQQQIHCTIWQ